MYTGTYEHIALAYRTRNISICDSVCEVKAIFTVHLICKNKGKAYQMDY